MVTSSFEPSTITTTDARGNAQPAMRSRSRVTKVKSVENCSATSGNARGRLSLAASFCSRSHMVCASDMRSSVVDDGDDLEPSPETFQAASGAAVAAMGLRCYKSDCKMQSDFGARPL